MKKFRIVLIIAAVIFLVSVSCGWGGVLSAIKEFTIFCSIITAALIFVVLMYCVFSRLKK
jgi:hypothetical protein